MTKKTAKTNAMRQLDTVHIAYQTLAYECDGKNFDGEQVAQQVGLPGERVFKTLVTRSESGEILVCCIPVNQQLNLKALAAAAACKRVDMTRQDELLPLTGYLRGGCSPIGMKRKYRTFIDISALVFDNIAISAGMRGLQIVLAPSDLIAHTAAILGNFSQAN